MTVTPARWTDANQRYLVAAVGIVREALDLFVARRHGPVDVERREAPPADAAERALRAAADRMPAPAALDTLCALLGLSSFERDVLVMCAAMDLDGGFATLCGRAHADARRQYPTFGLALAAFPEAHWSALSPAAPLRHWRLIEVGPGETVTASPLRIDERVLHYLAGVSHLDDRLRGLVEPVPVPRVLPPSHQAVAARAVASWTHGGREPLWPIIQLYGVDQAGKRAIAAKACADLGIQAYVLRSGDVPSGAHERDGLVRLWEREAILSRGALVVDADDAEGTDQARHVLAFTEDLRGMVFVFAREPLRVRRRTTVRLDVDRPTISEQHGLWEAALGSAARELNGQIRLVASQFQLSLEGIQAASADVRAEATATPHAGLGSILWDACRAQARPRLDDLAARIRTSAGWDDLVLPEAQAGTLREIAAHVRHRATVYETWGFAAKSARGLGISALFAGPSGTGKTLAAEVLANNLRLDLYRIDLSQVVNKYIGETEKNLCRVFDAAEEGGAVLLFDEADALFGRRSEVKDSHDRYANIEVGYLLQRMEAYRGLAILTTNMKTALDPAFLRRIRFVVQFPFPDAAQRAEIWRRIFPAAAPTDRLDVTRLARLNIAGGNIRNIALNAAFLAAAASEPVRMHHLLRAARNEYAKIEKPLTEMEINGWV